MKIYLLAFSLSLTSMCFEDMKDPENSIQLKTQGQKIEEEKKEVQAQENNVDIKK